MHCHANASVCEACGATVFVIVIVKNILQNALTRCGTEVPLFMDSSSVAGWKRARGGKCGVHDVTFPSGRRREI